MLCGPMSPETRSFIYEGNRLVFDEYGAGERAVILMPGLLFSRKMHGPLASTLAERGYRVLCLDLLGHGDSDRPPEMWNYSMTIFGTQVHALMDHLEIDKAVVGGTSLGANATLEAVAARREPGAGHARRDARAGQRAAGLRDRLHAADDLADLRRARSRGPSAGWPGWCPAAGPLLGRAPPRLDLARTPSRPRRCSRGCSSAGSLHPAACGVASRPPALVIGHPRDPIHPFNDSEGLVRELPNARLVEASSILELRLQPERLTGEIVRFIDECWDGPAKNRVQALALSAGVQPRTGRRRARRRRRSA